MDQVIEMNPDEIKNLLLEKRKEQSEIASKKINEILQEYNVRFETTTMLRNGQHPKIVIEVVPNE